MLRQGNYKRLLAYSSIEHMGIIALGIGFGAPLAVAGALLHVITHASAKGLAFFGAGSLLRGYDTKEIDGGHRRRAERCRGPGRCSSPPRSRCAGCRSRACFAASFRSSSEASRSAQYVGVTLLLVFVNLAFFGDRLARRADGPRPPRRARRASRRAARERSALDGRGDARLPVRRRRARACTCPATSPRCSPTPAHRLAVTRA